VKKVTDQDKGVDHVTRFLYIYYFVLYSPSLIINNNVEINMRINQEPSK
jgi:hypothetical protein